MRHAALHVRWRARARATTIVEDASRRRAARELGRVATRLVTRTKPTRGQLTRFKHGYTHVAGEAVEGMCQFGDRADEDSVGARLGLGCARLCPAPNPKWTETRTRGTRRDTRTPSHSDADDTKTNRVCGEDGLALVSVALVSPWSRVSVGSVGLGRSTKGEGGGTAARGLHRAVACRRRPPLRAHCGRTRIALVRNLRLESRCRLGRRARAAPPAKSEWDLNGRQPTSGGDTPTSHECTHSHTTPV